MKLVLSVFLFSGVLFATKPHGVEFSKQPAQQNPQHAVETYRPNKDGEVTQLQLEEESVINQELDQVLNGFYPGVSSGEVSLAESNLAIEPPFSRP